MADTPSPRLILVDDDPTTLFTLRRYLKGEFEVLAEAANGEQALDLCRALRPDLVLTDVNMPVMDGLTATRLITERFPDITTIILSSQGDFDVMRRAMAAGAREFLSKPVEPDELLSVLRRAARQQRERRGIMVDRVEAPGGGIWAFLEPTSGVGQTTLLLSLANELLTLQKSVLVVELDLLFGNAMLYLDLPTTGTSLDGLVELGAQVDRATADRCASSHSSTLKVLPPPLDPFAAAAVDLAQAAKAVLALEHLYDYVLVDLPAGIPERLLDVLDAARFLFVSTDDTLGGLKNLKVMLHILRAMDFPAPKLRPVVIGQRDRAPQLDQLHSILRKAGAEAAHVFPRDDRAVSEAVRAGQAVSRHAPESAYTQAVREFLVPLLGLPSIARKQPAQTSFLKRLFG